MATAAKSRFDISKQNLVWYGEYLEGSRAIECLESWKSYLESSNQGFMRINRNRDHTHLLIYLKKNKDLLDIKHSKIAIDHLTKINDGFFYEDHWFSSKEYETLITGIDQKQQIIILRLHSRIENIARCTQIRTSVNNMSL